MRVVYKCETINTEKNTVHKLIYNIIQTKYILYKNSLVECRHDPFKAGTRINRGRRGTAISGIWPSRSRYRENDRDNRDKWNPKKTSLKIVFCHF